jgi:hypothetical protein|tara:strand:- start:421 stop:582 length:162 start_codon:yes stop_codon:yes gene_type:complete
MPPVVINDIDGDISGCTEQRRMLKTLAEKIKDGKDISYKDMEKLDIRRGDVDW